MIRRDVRSQIVAAAIEEVRAHGWPATSMQRVRERAGVSNGSLFHHFPSRADLEAAVLGEALTDHQATMLRTLTPARTARRGVRGVVLAHLGWIGANPSVALMLLSASPGALQEQLTGPILEQTRRFFAEEARWLGSRGWSGTPDILVINAMWLGPANELARGALSIGADLPSGELAELLADAAWRALSPHIGKERS